MPVEAVLSLGSNLGDRLAHLTGAADALAPYAVSPVYETPPWGPVAQADYLNLVLLVRGDRDWLALARECEQAAGRVRDVRWGPRTLDVDVVTVRRDGREVVSDDPALTLPHPRAHERAFVLVPWLDVDAAAVLGGRPVAELVAALPASERDAVRRRDDLQLGLRP